MKIFEWNLGDFCPSIETPFTQNLDTLKSSSEFKSYDEGLHMRVFLSEITL